MSFCSSSLSMPLQTTGGGGIKYFGLMSVRPSVFYPFVNT